MESWVGTILLHVFPSSIAEHLCCTWGIGNSTRGSHHLASCAGGITSVVPETLQTPGHHFLESNHEDTICATVANNIPGKM
jgi:hypothetical protein